MEYYKATKNIFNKGTVAVKILNMLFLKHFFKLIN